MASGKLEAYYWEVYALIFESDDILSLDDPGFSLSDEDVASHMHKGPIPVAGENDRAWPIDIELVSFETVLQRIRERFS
ncbi:MAG: hypothetical protein HYZ35_03515 [Chloroflexi bacterium]|nr:hypothetical protein [Chloroflexota bacterium]